VRKSGNQRQGQGRRLQPLWLEQKAQNICLNCASMADYRKTRFSCRPTAAHCIAHAYRNRLAPARHEAPDRRRSDWRASAQNAGRTLQGQKYVWVEPLQTKLEPGYVLSPAEQNETNNLQLRVFWNPERKSSFSRLP